LSRYPARARERIPLRPEKGSSRPPSGLLSGAAGGLRPIQSAVDEPGVCRPARSGQPFQSRLGLGLHRAGGRRCMCRAQHLLSSRMDDRRPARLGGSPRKPATCDLTGAAAEMASNRAISWRRPYHRIRRQERWTCRFSSARQCVLAGYKTGLMWSGRRGATPRVPITQSSSFIV
jgi:hypothetical protein